MTSPRLSHASSPSTALLTGVCLGALLLSSCQQTESYGRSLLGEPLPVPERTPKERHKLEDALAVARVRYAEDPRNQTAIIWLGRRTAYLSRYEEAIGIYTRGLAMHPESYRLLRHRGHRYISTRRLERAIADLGRAAALTRGKPNQVEQDGMPNARNIPIGTTHGNIYYHLGLAHYLNGDFEAALEAYDHRLTLDRNDDNRCSTAYWRYIILRRLLRPADADAAVLGIAAKMDVIENTVYHRLVLLYRGLGKPGDFEDVSGDTVHSANVSNATAAYGVSMWQLFNGYPVLARTLWKEIVRSSKATSAFGYIAAEAELARNRE